MAVLLQIDAYDPVTAAPITLRAASHDDPALCHTDGKTWWPAIAKLPTLGYDLFDGDFGGWIETASSSLTLTPEPWPLFGRYSFGDARLRLWVGTPGVDWSAWVLRFDGRVTAQPQIASGIATVAFAVDDRWLDAPLLATYAGTGGAEGPAALKGSVKPLALGAPRYLAGTLIDPTNTVVQLSSFGAIEGVEAAYDGLALFAAPVGDYASYASLAAATIPPGGWATALAVGMVRHGAPPYGQLSYKVRGDKAGPDGWARLPGELIRRVALLSGGAGKINDASLDALDLARPYHLSLSVTEQTTAREAIQRLAASVNAVAGVSWLGQLFARPVGIGAPSTTLKADGSALPPVGSVEQTQMAAPWWKLAIEADRTWEVHSQDAVQFGEPPAPGATNSADPNSPLGNSTVGVVLGQLQTIASLTDPYNGYFVGRLDAIEEALDTDPNTNVVSRLVALEVSNRQGAPNLVKNPDFGDGLNNWQQTGGGWIPVSGYATGPFAQNNGNIGAFLYQDIPVQAGVGYSLSLMADPDAGGGSQAYIEWRTASGFVANSDSLYPDGWTPRAMSPVMPAPGASTIARLRLRQNASGSAGRWSQVQFQQGPATAFRNDAQVQYTAARLSELVTLRQNDYNSLAQRAQTLEAQVAGTTPSYFKGEITRLETAAATTTYSLTQSLEQLSSTIYSLSSPNLIANGAFHNGFAAWAVSNGSATWQIFNPSVGEPDTFAAILGGNTSSFMFTDTQIEGGKPYMLSFRSACDGGPDAGRLYVEYWTPGFGSRVGNYPNGPQARTDWSQSSGGPYYAPNEATIARFGFISTNNDGAWRRITRLQIQQGTVATEYSDAQSLAGLTATVATQGGTLAEVKNKTDVRLQAFLSQTVSVPGATAAVVLKAETSNGQTTSDVALIGRSISFFAQGQDPSTARLAMDITTVDGVPVVGIYGHLRVTGAVSTANLRLNAVTEKQKYDMPGPQYGDGPIPSGNWRNIVSFTLFLDDSAEVMIDWWARVAYSGTADYGFDLVIDGSSSDAGLAGINEAAPFGRDLFFLGAGSHSVILRARGSQGMTIERASVLPSVNYR
jgi:hypothetical protein